MNPEPQSPQEQPEIPTQPVVPQAQPDAVQKKGLSKKAIIAIIIGSIVGFLILVFLALVMLFAVISGMEKGTTNTLSSDTKTSADFDSLETYKTDDFSFLYPADWQQKDMSNQTTIIGGVEPDAYVVILSGSKDSDVIVTYTYNKGSAEPVEREKARSAMETATQTQLDATASQLAAMRESTGHGCAANAVYTNAPALVEKGDLIGYTYGFTCDSFYGPVQGEYGVWYDEYGAQHRLLVSSLQEYWDENQADLEEIMKSAKAL